MGGSYQKPILRTRMCREEALPSGDINSLERDVAFWRWADVKRGDEVEMTEKVERQQLGGFSVVNKFVDLE